MSKCVVFDDLTVCFYASLEETKSDETSLPAHLLWKEARVGKNQAVDPSVLRIYDECVSITLCL